MPTSAADLQRVVVIGMSGAGKSTAARRLAAMLDLPRVELDALYWGPAWTPRPDFREVDDWFRTLEGAQATWPQVPA